MAQPVKSPVRMTSRVSSSLTVKGTRLSPFLGASVFLGGIPGFLQSGGKSDGSAAVAEHPEGVLDPAGRAPQLQEKPRRPLRDPAADDVEGQGLGAGEVAHPAP